MFDALGMFGTEVFLTRDGGWCGTVFGAGRWLVMKVCFVRRVFGAEGFWYGTVVGDESMFCTEGFWCGTDHLPEIDPAGLPFLGSPPPTLRNQKIGTATINEPKKECLFCI